MILKKTKEIIKKKMFFERKSKVTEVYFIFFCYGQVGMTDSETD